MAVVVIEVGRAAAGKFERGCGVEADRVACKMRFRRGGGAGRKVDGAAVRGVKGSCREGVQGGNGFAGGHKVLLEFGGRLAGGYAVGHHRRRGETDRTSHAWAREVGIQIMGVAQVFVANGRERNN
ncbi:hypothetical protein B0T14DRAFT_506330 [Immersiella caudata]|uniref:Uncharacterized protein n=1 Tax=Immersiella caudata TaxID=314043 RepID=A0AA40CDC6_9PEZI|nr:hypothetical protein B0T14DRAFT_506330 [Immersiella caudata]